jgi:hypothetical protein
VKPSGTRGDADRYPGGFVCGTPSHEEEARHAEDHLTGDPDAFDFLAPAEDVLRRTLRHRNGDLTLRGPGGTLRLAHGAPVWRRYTDFLAAAGIDPEDVD